MNYDAIQGTVIRLISENGAAAVLRKQTGESTHATTLKKTPTFTDYDVHVMQVDKRLAYLLPGSLVSTVRRQMAIAPELPSGTNVEDGDVLVLNGQTLRLRGCRTVAPDTLTPLAYLADYP